MPVVCLTASSSLVVWRSSSRWRVMTLTDCGVSRGDCTSLPTLTSRAMYWPVSSVAWPPAPSDTRTSGSAAVPVWAWAAPRLAISAAAKARGVGLMEISL